MARLISWLLNVVYVAVLLAASPFIVWQAVRTGKYREGFREKFLGFAPRRRGDRPCAWIHAVSVGEVNLMATLLGALRLAHPEWEFVVSTTSRTGFELARKKFADHSVFYCPLDFSWAVRAAMRRVRPTLLILAELELWPNLIAAAKDHGARVAIVNGRLSDHSYPGYRRIRPFVAWILRQVDLVAAQDVESGERFLALGAPVGRVSVTGSLKYDGAQTDRLNARTRSLCELAGFADGDVVFLAGSTQEPEEKYAVEIFRKLFPKYPQLRLVLVPRHPERFESVAQELEASGLAWCRRSQLEAASRSAAVAEPPSASRLNECRSERATHHSQLGTPRSILLVDTVGELGAWWGTARIAFVGGSFGNRGGQNMLEPAAYGAAVAFGPNTWNFRDIVSALLGVRGAVVVHDAAELESFVQRCLAEPSFSEELGQHAQALVRANLGATGRTVAWLESLVGGGARGRAAA
ncbi:MAG: 3-deoxy-D-manno-octulosonic acid transferase [Pirellulales bacterium]|nr:3-deoxy-D-manno-octulosonic acid transferase [Pirellulales bacterium]